MREKKRNKFAMPSLGAGLLLLISTNGLVATGASYQQEPDPQKEPGRIVGRVTMEGRFERPPLLKVYKNRAFCGATVPNESLLVSPDGGVQNVIIIIPKTRGEKSATQRRSLVLDNKNCAFVPHVQVAPVGSELLLLNSDPILHDVHARLGSETLFNIGLPTWRQVTKRLTRTGIVAIECDVLHTWMSAYILVTSSPYFAVTNGEGGFAIDGVPAGAYNVEVWHEKLGRQLRKVIVKESHTSKLDLVFPCLFC